MFVGTRPLLSRWSDFGVSPGIGRQTMAAEAPDHHRNDLGRLEEVRNGLNGADTVGHKEGIQ